MTATTTAEAVRPDADSRVFHPSNGPLGSVFQTQDGKVYCRSPFGARLVPPAIGSALVVRQQASSRAIRFLVKRMLLFVTLAFLAGVFMGMMS